VGQFIVFFMADNLYVGEKTSTNTVEWRSYDGEKMEASHSTKDAKDYVDRVTAAYGAINSGHPLLLAYKWLGLNNIVGARAVLGDSNFVVP
jgi:hypothetical protein